MKAKVQEWSITRKQTTHHAGSVLSTSTKQEFVANPNEPGIKVTLTATTTAGNAQVSKTVHSRYNRRTLQHVENGSETHWERDAFGRVTKETRYALAAGATGRSAKQTPDECIVSVYSADGTLVERTYQDGSQSLSQLDGLQRAWHESWRRSAGDKYVPIEQRCMAALDQDAVAGSWAWDYLPGGQAVRKDSPSFGLAGRHQWLLQESNVINSEHKPGEVKAIVAKRKIKVEGDVRIPHLVTLMFNVLEHLKGDNAANYTPFSYVLWDGAVWSGQANAIGQAYLCLVNGLEMSEMCIAGKGWRNTYPLLKVFQAFAGLKDSEGIKDAILWDNDFWPIEPVPEITADHSTDLAPLPDVANVSVWSVFYLIAISAQDPIVDVFIATAKAAEAAAEAAAKAAEAAKASAECTPVGIIDALAVHVINEAAVAAATAREFADSRDRAIALWSRESAKGNAATVYRSHVEKALTHYQLHVDYIVPASKAQSIIGHDVHAQLKEQTGLGAQCLANRTTTQTSKTDGTTQRSVRWADDTDQEHLRIEQHYDRNGDVISHTRGVGEQTSVYSFERDQLGRVTKVTRPDATTVERSYHGFSNHVTQLKVGGKVVASQTVTEPGKLKTRTVGSREYSFVDGGLTLPDKTQLRTQHSAQGEAFQSDGISQVSQTRAENAIQLSATPADMAAVGWQHTLGSGRVPGRLQRSEKGPRGATPGFDWQTLRGQSIASLRADGHTQRIFADSKGQLLRTCQAHEDVLYRYDERGHLQVRQVHALTGAGQWQVLSEHDRFNRETSRTFLRNGEPCFSQAMTWQGDGRLQSKASYQDGKLLRTERFTYDKLDRLQSYTCDAKQAAMCPKNADGTAIKAQHFEWDALDNLTGCISTPFSGPVINETFTFGSSTDPTRLTAVGSGEQPVPLDWNSNGQLQEDGRKRKLSYTKTGQLSNVKDAQGKLLTRYEYDGLQRLAAQYSAHDQTTRELRYDGQELIGEVCFDEKGTPIRRTSVSPGLAQYDDDEVRWLIDDPQCGIVGQIFEGQLQLAPLLPFGEGAALDKLVSGYNGMRCDPVTGHYHAGNGYRSYDPELRRYAQPDWLSPFGDGGVNDYAHCPDPVNLHDPSGAIMLSRWHQKQDEKLYADALRDTEPMPVGSRWRDIGVGLVLTVVGIALSALTGPVMAPWFILMTTFAVASFALDVASKLTEDSDKNLSYILGVASIVYGVLSLGQSAKGALMGGLKLLGKSRRLFSLGRRLANFRGVAKAARNIPLDVLGELPKAGGIVAPMKRGMFAAIKANYAQTSKWITPRLGGVADYLGRPVVSDLSSARYARMGWSGGVLKTWHRIQTGAASSAALTIAASIPAKSIDLYVLYGSIQTTIDRINDPESSVSLWSRSAVAAQNVRSWVEHNNKHLAA
ncbi:RHS repeat domain-containing protein [Pseudomonas shirazensis]|uniref:RHS repeat domain-containing protein n=1 Tax=Pseudomonas shirazensis TaxID=2745494 RepID=UPI003D2D969F